MLKESGDRFSSIGNKLSVGITAPVAAATGMAGKLAVDFDSGMRKVNTMLYKIGDEFEETKKKALEFSSEFGMANADVTESMYQALSAGVKEEELFNVLEVGAKAAKGGFTDMATAVDGLSNILNSYGLSAENAEGIANQMLIAQNKGKTTFGELATSVSKVSPIFNQLGLGTDELFTSLAVLTANGVATSESVSGLKAALSNIIKPTSEAAKAAEALGISFDAKTLGDKGMIGFAEYIQDAIRNTAPEYDRLIKENEVATKIMMSLENEKSKEGKKKYKELKKLVSKQKAEMEILATAADSPIAGFANLFGSVEGLNAMLILGSEQGASLFKSTMEAMKTDTEALDKAFKEIDESKASQMQKTWVKLQNTLTKLGENVLPLLNQGLEFVNGMLDKFNNLSPATQQVLLGMVGTAAMAGPTFKVLGAGLKGLSKIKSLTNSSKAIKDIAVGAASAGKNIGGLTQKAGTLLPILTKAGLLTSTGLVAGVAIAGTTIHLVNKETNKMVKSFDYLGQSLGESGKEFEGIENKIDTVKNKLGALTSTEVKITPEAQATFLGEVQLIVDEVKNNLDKKLEEDLETAKKRGYTDEEIEKVKSKNQSRKNEVDNYNKKIAEITNNVQSSNRAFTDGEKNQINEIMKNISKINMQSSGITLEEIDSYIALKNDSKNTKAEDLVPVIKELNEVVASQKELLKSRNVEEEKMLRFDLDNEKITKQEYENRISILESQYTQDLAEIERLRGEELVKMYETYGKVMDYINIETGELENNLTRFFTTLGFDAERDKRQVVQQYGTGSQQEKILGFDYTQYNTKLQENKDKIDANTQSIDAQKQVNELDSLAVEDNALKTFNATSATQELTNEVFNFDQFTSQAASNINNSINGINEKVNSLNSISLQTPTPNSAPIGDGAGGFKMYSKGGIANKPSIFGEDGAEMAIPLKRGNKRSEDLVRQTASILGMDLFNETSNIGGGMNKNNTYNASFSFNVMVNGGVEGLEKKMESLARMTKEKFTTWLNEVEQEKERASFGH